MLKKHLLPASRAISLFHKRSELNHSFTPRQIFEYLDKYIIGQAEAKKAVSVAFRNRWRRMQLKEDFRKEVMPKNILMVGPTGCGKTEIARRLAKIGESPFIKVEATKFTEIGYHGKDVDQIIHDLANLEIKRMKHRHVEEVEKQSGAINDLISTQILNTMLGPDFNDSEIKEQKMKALKSGEYEDRYLTIEIPFDFEDKHNFLSIDDFINYIGKNFPYGHPQNQRQKLTVKEAMSSLNYLYLEKLEQDLNYKQKALNLVEEEGIVFLDEIDKIATPENSITYDKSPSEGGVQRDLLPLVEGTVINTKYGNVRTDNILFIASGAFSSNKPSDLMPELLGRFPIRVELKPLTQIDFENILKTKENNLLVQQTELLKQDGVILKFEEDAVKEMARIAWEANLNIENVGARRLFGLVEKIVEEISFEAPFEEKNKSIMIDAEFVRNRKVTKPKSSSAKVANGKQKNEKPTLADKTNTKSGKTNEKKPSTNQTENNIAKGKKPAEPPTKKKSSPLPLNGKAKVPSVTSSEEQNSFLENMSSLSSQNSKNNNKESRSTSNLPSNNQSFTKNSTANTFYTPVSRKLKPVYFDFDIFIKRVSIKKEQMRLSLIEKYYKNRMSQKMKDHMLMLDTHQKKIVRALYDLQKHEEKIKKIHKSKKIDKYVSGNRTKLFNSLQNYLKTDPFLPLFIQNDSLILEGSKSNNGNFNSTEKTWKEAKDLYLNQSERLSDRALMSNEIKSNESGACCNRESIIKALEKKMSIDKEKAIARELKLSREILKLQKTNQKIRAHHKQSLINFIKGIKKIKENLEKSKKEKSGEPYENIKALVKEMLEESSLDSEYQYQSESSKTFETESHYSMIESKKE